MQNIAKILELSRKRIAYKKFSSDHVFLEVQKELSESKDEFRDKNHIYLEDELGDVFWDFCCLLSALEQEGKISSREAVFKRSYRKFSERIAPDGTNNGNWDEVKAMQKARDKADHDNFYS